MRAIFRFPSLILLALTATPVLADTPSKEVRKTAIAPAGMSPTEALESLEAIPEIFELYQPVVPWAPGLKMEIGKEVISRGSPAILALPVTGSAPYLPSGINERALVTARTQSVNDCPAPLTAGKMIVLDFAGSTRNVERRIDRIEIRVCASQKDERPVTVSAVGSLYDGYLVIDPEFNRFNEEMGAKAFQTAFIRQVDPMIEAVESLWSQGSR